MTRDDKWAFTTVRATVVELHARGVPDEIVRTVEVCDPVDSALVLGSTQDVAIVARDAASARGLTVVRRRSGGGAVLVEPGALTWIDVLMPRDDPLWVDDVGESVEWLGWVCHGALQRCGVTADPPHRSMQRTRWSSLVCFAGLGPGEVAVAGAKVVGISQRRTRDGARFSLSVLHSWDPTGTAGLFALSAGEQMELAGELSRGARAVEVPSKVLVSAFREAIQLA